VTAVSLPETDNHAELSVAVQRAVRVLLACQDQDGWWPDGAVTEASLAAEALLARWFLRAGEAPGQEVAAGLIRSGQRADGSWAGAEPGAAADLSASVLSYLALALTGDSRDAYHMAAAAGWIRDAGGIDAVGVTARAWLALFGVAAWTDVPVPVPEALWLPARGAQTGSPVVAVTLAILGAVRPVRAPGIGLTELQASRSHAAADARHRPAVALGAARSIARPAALRRCGNWLARWQEHGAGPVGLRPAWPLSLVALHAVGWRADDPPVAPGLPPLAHTVLAVDALRAAGLPADHPAIAAAARWLLQSVIEVPVLGPGARGDAQACGWSFCPDGYPRPADTAVVLCALSGVEPAGSPVIAAAIRWLAGTQDRDGGWDRSAALTGYCLRALATCAADDPAADQVIRRGVVWLLRAQQPSGAWLGRAGSSDLLATSVVLPALLSAGVRVGKPCITGGAGWLLAQQNADGGWHLGGITGPPGAADSDVAGTSVVLTALLAAGRGSSRGGVAGGAAAAVDWLVRAQRADGRWAALPGGGGPSAGILLPLAALGEYLAAGEPRSVRGNLAVGIQGPPGNRPDHQYRPRR
jgi:squalene-hopene/tetraprenyl-beta-curcumene cyclase